MLLSYSKLTIKINYNNIGELNDLIFAVMEVAGIEMLLFRTP